MEDREPRLRTRDDNLNLVPRGLLARLVEREFRHLRLTIYHERIYIFLTFYSHSKS